MKLLMFFIVIIVVTAAVMILYWAICHDTVCKYPDRFLYVPVIPKSRVRYEKICIGKVPKDIVRKLKKSITPLANIATKAKGNRLIRQIYACQTNKIKYICKEINNQISECVAYPQIENEKFEEMSSRLYIVEAVFDSIYQDIENSINNLNAEKKDKQDAEIMLLQNPPAFQNLENMLQMEKEDSKVLEEKYKNVTIKEFATKVMDISSPFAGEVVSLQVKNGQVVKRGQILGKIKGQFPVKYGPYDPDQCGGIINIFAPKTGIIDDINITAGYNLDRNQKICAIWYEP